MSESTDAPNKPQTMGDAFPEFEGEPGDAEAAMIAAGSAQPQPAGAKASGRNIEAMLNVGLNVQVILGHSRMPISQLLKFSRGSVIELDKKIGEPVDIVINDRLVARGDLVKLAGDRIGVSLTEIVKDYIPEG